MLDGLKQAVATKKVLLPTRVITYAWGERYVNELLSYTIPALLAPGNLPYVAAQVPCELVILSEQRLFEAIENHNAIKQAKKHCSLRLISLDDLVTTPESYGLALTFALHRGFADLGPAMTDNWQIFLNADFLLAENSLKHLLDRLMDGERLVASPSYCVNSAAVIPELKKFVDPVSGSLVIPPREMAKLILQHRHNTIIGKTLNQNQFHLRYTDQFYWEVNPKTLIGHQMPVAIVGMRPEVYIAEPNAFWDHGLIYEFCPTTKPCVLGDSDEFLMMELRDKDVSKDEIIYGLPFAEDLAEKMILWVTPYQRDFVRYPLILHADEIPQNVDDGFAKLKAYVDHVFSYVPDELPSHLDHPQWAYHSSRFTQARNKYIAEQVKKLPTGEALPFFLKSDQDLWEFELQKRELLRARQNVVEMMQRQIDLLRAAAAKSQEELYKEKAALDERFVKEVNSAAIMQMAAAKWAKPSNLSRILISDSGFRKALKNHSDAMSRLQAIDENEKIIDAVAGYYEAEIKAIDEKIAEIENSRPLLIAEDIPSATIFKKMRRGRKTSHSHTAHTSRLRRLAREIYYAILGKWPFVKPTSPYFVALQPLRQSLKAAADGRAQDILFVGERTVNLDDLISLNGINAWADVSVLTSQLGFGIHTRPPQFDVCVCDLTFDEIRKFPDIYRGLQRFARPGATVIAFHLNNNGEILPTTDIDFARGLPASATRVYGVGNRTIQRNMLRYQSAISSAGGGILPKLMSLIRLGLLLPRVRLAQPPDASFAPLSGPPVPPTSASITIVTTMLEFDDDDGSLEYARAVGIYVDGVEAPVNATSEVSKDVAVQADTKIILTFGQSNAANTGEKRHTACDKVHVFNPMDGKFYRAVDPLPGASNGDGSVWSYLGDLLVDAGDSSVLFVPIAFGGTFIKDWAPGGNCYRRLIFTLQRMRVAGLTPSIMCWHQGEADANHTQISTEKYLVDFIAMLNAVRSFGIDAPVYCALGTLCEAGEHPYDNKDAIRRAQQQLTTMKRGVLPGPDTDLIGVEHRFDRCHFSESGQKLAAQAWFDAIQSSQDARNVG
ncbi:MAG: hypothetical protein JSR61_00660 [Proteobacteria bacterium]|nr:hypothetical protein [Pseudomonadota bacterium]